MEIGDDGLSLEQDNAPLLLFPQKKGGVCVIEER